MVAVNQIRDEYRLEATAVGVEQTKSAAEGLAAATEKVAVSSERQERKVISVQRALEKFAAANDQAFRAQQQVERAQALVNRAFEQGLGDSLAYQRATVVLAERQEALARVTAQVAAANDNATAKMRAAWSALSAQGAAQEKVYQASEKLNAGWGRLSAQGAAQARTLQGLDAAQAASTKATGLHAGAWQSLGFQLNDTLTSLASGASPMMVLAQQGGQVYQALDGPKGVTGGLKEIGNFLVGLITPARLAVGGLAAIGVAGIAAALSWQSTQAEVRQALSGVGRAAGVTAGELEGIAVASAAASNTSVGAARSLALELAKTGKIARDNLAPIAALGKNFAATLGLDATEGNAQLARSFAEPGKGAEDLARRYGLLSDATVRYIQQLEDSNERGRAQQALIDALRPKLVNAAELTTGWAYAWDKVSTAARNAWDWIGKATDKAMGGTGGGSDEEVRKALEDRLRYLQSAAGRAAGSRGGDPEQFNRTIADLQRQLSAVEQRTAKVRTDAQDAAKNDLSLRAGLIARAVAPELQALDELRAKRKTLADDMANQGAGPGMKDQAVALARLDAQIRDFTEAGGALELQERKRAAASQIVLDAMKARTPAEVGAIAARKALNDAEGTATFQAERTAQAERERTQAATAAQKALDDQSGAVQRNTEGNNRVADAWRVSSEAGALYAESVRKASEDVESRGLPADQKLARQQAYLREQLSEQIKERARAIAQKNQEVSVDENLARLVDKQVVSHEQAAQQRQRDLDVARLQGLAAVAEGEQRTALLRQVDELTSAYGRENAVRADRAAQGMIADQERELAQLRLEAELVGNSTIERERAVAVLRAQQELQRQGIALSSEKGQTYIDNAAMLSDIRTARTQFERLAQDVSSVVSGIFDDMFRAGNKGLAGFFDSFARGFARIGTRILEQNLIAPLVTSAMGGGSGAAGAGANLFGGFDFGKIEKAVSEGSFSGIMESFGDLLKPGAGSKGGGFASSKLGGGLLSAGVGASIGYQSQSPFVGALGGAAAGFAMGGGPVGAVIGGAAGLLGGLFGKSQAKKEAEKKLKEQLEAYREAYRQAEPEIKKLQATFRGESLGNVGGQIDAAFQQMYQANVTASKAGDQTRANQLARDFEAYAVRLRDVFMNAFEGTLAEVAAGFGTSGPFAQANAAISTLGESLKAFVKDAESLPQAEANSARARAAAQQAALAALDPPKALSDTQSRLAAIQGTAAGLSRVLQDLGMSADEAAKAIADRTTKAMAALRAEFTADLKARTNEATGKGYLNEVADLVKEREGLLADARAIGAGTADVTAYFRASAQKIVDGAELTGDAFTALVKRFPELRGQVKEFAQAIDQAAAAAAAASRALDYQNRLFAAGNDTSTLAGQLAAYDRQAQQEREREIKDGGQALADLEAAQYAERLRIVRDYQKEAADAERQRMEAASKALDAFVLDIKEYLDGLKAGPSSNLSPADRLAAARSQFDAQMAAARAGDRDALDSITRSATTLLEASKGYNASSPAYQADLKRVTDALAALPKQVSAEQFIVDAIKDTSKTLLQAVQANSPSLIAAALKGSFDELDKNTDGLLSAAEFIAGLGPLATKAEQAAARDIFKSIDTNGDGFISKLELVRIDLLAALAKGSAAEIAKSLSASFSTLDTSVNGLLDYTEFAAGLGPLATKAEQQAAKIIFTAIDANGDGQISKLELVRAQAVTTAANTAGTKTGVDTSNTIATQQKDILAAQKTVLDAVESLSQTQSSTLGALRTIQAGAASTLSAINTVSGLQKSQLEALNNQFAYSPFTAPNGVRLDSNLVTALNKIVFNTANTVIGQQTGASYAFARGGYVSGPGTGTSDSIGARLSNGEYVMTADATRRYGRSMLDAMNDNRLSAPVMPVPAPMREGESNAALLAELRALRGELASLRGDVREGNDIAENGHLGTIGAVKRNTVAVQEGNAAASRQGLARKPKAA